MFLFLSSIGTGEIIIILLFVLIFFGADSIPGLSRTLGRGMRQMKDAVQDIQDEITKTTTEMKRDINANKALGEAAKTFENPIKEITQQLDDSGKEIKRNIEGMGEQSPTVQPPKQKSQNIPLDQMDIDE